VFDATSAGAHIRNNATLQKAGKKVIDLTPAAIGPFTIPVINGDANLDEPNVNMVTCGGQGIIPIVYAVKRATNRVIWGEIVASISSKSAGPGTGTNIDEFTETTSKAICNLGGAEKGKAIIILNPAEPPLIMRDTVFALSQGRPATICGCASPASAVFGPEDDGVPRGRGRGAISAGLCRQSRHHDLGGAGVGGRLDGSTADEGGRVMARANPNKLYVQDVTLRDGMHSIRHQYHLESVRDIARALDRAKVDAIEICHGDGITGSTFNYGFGAHDHGEWIEAVAAECEHARVAVLLIPGIGTVRDLKAAYDRGRAACASRPIAPRRMSPSNISRRR